MGVTSWSLDNKVTFLFVLEMSIHFYRSFGYYQSYYCDTFYQIWPLKYRFHQFWMFLNTVCNQLSIYIWINALSLRKLFLPTLLIRCFNHNTLIWEKHKKSSWLKKTSNMTRHEITTHVYCLITRQSNKCKAIYIQKYKYKDL